jgi:formate dehydrogenase subunit beta
MTKIEELKEVAKKLLQDGKVKYIIAYEQGTNGWLSSPAFI